MYYIDCIAICVGGDFFGNSGVNKPAETVITINRYDNKPINVCKILSALSGMYFT
jgi:hypothetical protein